MELQLGLALPINPPPIIQKPQLDLNSSYAFNESNKVLPLFTCNCNHNSSTFTNKRCFSQLFDQNKHVLLPTLPLLPLTPDQPNDDEEEDHSSNCSAITKNDGAEVEALVGWPPINSWRKKLRHHNYDVQDAENSEINRSPFVGMMRGSKSNSLYVKVKMEGVGIARKVDLSLHHSFQTLKETLMDMFEKCDEDSDCYELVYQDKEGDWLVAEDVPWRSFIHCAQRLKLLKRLKCNE